MIKTIFKRKFSFCRETYFCKENSRKIVQMLRKFSQVLRKLIFHTLGKIFLTLVKIFGHASRGFESHCQRSLPPYSALSCYGCPQFPGVPLKIVGR